MKNHVFVSAIIYAVFAIFSPQNTLADGMMMYKPDPYADRWDYASESSQQAYINYEDGREKMILSIGVDDQSQDAVWLFPVPSQPDEVTIDVLTELPKFSGEQLNRKAESNIRDIKKSLLITQIWPAIFYLNDLTLKSSIPTNSIMTGDSLLGQSGYFGQTDVQVFEHIEKEGIVSEIVTAKTSQGLYDYLKAKNLDIDPQSINAINHYIGQDYSFVVSWLSAKKSIPINEEINQEYLTAHLEDYMDLVRYPGINDVYNYMFEKYPAYNSVFDMARDQETRTAMVGYILSHPETIKRKTSLDPYRSAKQKALFVTFPTEKIFFPLIPTSVYGSAVVPATIRVVGYLSPEIFSEIKPFTEISYYYDEYANQISDQLFSQNPDHFGYTKIEINAPSKLFTKDLWISQWPSLVAYYHHFIAFYSFWFGFIILLIISFVTACLVNLLLFKSRSLQIGYIGLANIFSIILPAILISFYNTDKNPNSEIINVYPVLKQKGYVFKRFMIMILITIFFVIPLLFYLISFLNEMLVIGGSINGINILFSFFYLITSIPIILVTIAIFFLSQVKKEDRHLFATLEKYHYSKWTFVKSDWKKLLFVPLFSAFFVILSYIAVAIISATV